MLVPAHYKNHSRAEFCALYERMLTLRQEHRAMVLSLKDMIENPARVEPVHGNRNDGMIRLLDGVRDAAIPVLRLSRLQSSTALNLMIHPDDFHEVTIIGKNQDALSADDFSISPEQAKAYAQHSLKSCFRSAVKGIQLAQMVADNYGYYIAYVTRELKITLETMSKDCTTSLERAASLPHLNDDPATPTDDFRQALLKGFGEDMCMSYDEVEELIYATAAQNLQTFEAMMVLRRALVASIGQHIPFSNAYIDRNPGIKHLLGLAMA